MGCQGLAQELQPVGVRRRQEPLAQVPASGGRRREPEEQHARKLAIVTALAGGCLLLVHFEVPAHEGAIRLELGNQVLQFSVVGRPGMPEQRTGDFAVPKRLASRECGGDERRDCGKADRVVPGRGAQEPLLIGRSLARRYVRENADPLQKRGKPPRNRALDP